MLGVVKQEQESGHKCRLARQVEVQMLMKIQNTRTAGTGKKKANKANQQIQKERHKNPSPENVIIQSTLGKKHKAKTDEETLGHQENR